MFPVSELRVQQAVLLGALEPCSKPQSHRAAFESKAGLPRRTLRGDVRSRAHSDGERACVRDAGAGAEAHISVTFIIPLGLGRDEQGGRSKAFPVNALSPAKRNKIRIRAVSCVVEWKWK